MNTTPQSELPSLAGVKLRNASDPATRFGMLLWGPSKSGKTTLASTAPGKRLWLMFDPEGDAAIRNDPDTIVADFSAENATRITDSGASINPFGLQNVLDTNPDIQTVVLDSVTTYMYMCLVAGVAKVSATAQGKSSTMMQPGLAGYGARNNLVTQMVVNLAALCRRYNKNLILITHEDTAEKNAEGQIVEISMLLSDKLANSLGLMMSEIWHIDVRQGKREISVRPHSLKKPMGSRMFKNTADRFVWKFDADTRQGVGIADWFAEWQKSGGKIPLPS